MWIVQVALKRPYTFIVLAFLIAIFGSLSAVRTPTDIFPKINIPVVSVVWTYSGLLPKDMSDRVIYYYERQPRCSSFPRCSAFCIAATVTRPRADRVPKCWLNLPSEWENQCVGT